MFDLFFCFFKRIFVFVYHVFDQEPGDHNEKRPGQKPDDCIPVHIAEF
jgi:hypothetical protein